MCCLPFALHSSFPFSLSAYRPTDQPPDRPHARFFFLLGNQISSDLKTVLVDFFICSPQSWGCVISCAITLCVRFVRLGIFSFSSCLRAFVLDTLDCYFSSSPSKASDSNRLMMNAMLLVDSERWKRRRRRRRDGEKWNRNKNGLLCVNMKCY